MSVLKKCIFFLIKNDLPGGVKSISSNITFSALTFFNAFSKLASIVHLFSSISVSLLKSFMLNSTTVLPKFELLSSLLIFFSSCVSSLTFFGESLLIEFVVENGLKLFKKFNCEIIIFCLML